MNKKNWYLEDATNDTLSVFPDEPTEESDSPADVVEPAEQSPEVLTGVVLTRCHVLDYNPHSNILVYERDGKQIQTNAITNYDNSGWIAVE